MEIQSVSQSGEVCNERKVFSIGVPSSKGINIGGGPPIRFGQHVVLIGGNVEGDSGVSTQQCLAYFSRADEKSFLKMEPIILNGDTRLALVIVVDGKQAVCELVVVKHTGDDVKGVQAWLDTLCDMEGPMSLYRQRQQLQATWSVKLISLWKTMCLKSPIRSRLPKRCYNRSGGDSYGIQTTRGS